MDALILKIVITLVLFFIGWGFGRFIEQKHLKELEEKEQRLLYIRIDTNKFQTSEALKVRSQLEASRGTKTLRR